MRAMILRSCALRATKASAKREPRVKRHHEQKTVPFAADQMFDLITDVEQYPSFIPGCETIAITREWEEEGVQFMEAAMTASFKVYRETVHTRVTMDRAAHKVTVDYLDGPFKHLHNVWTFTDRPDRGDCLIDLYIEFEFRNRGLQLAIKPVFSKAVRRMVRAFDKRARAVYG